MYRKIAAQVILINVTGIDHIINFKKFIGRPSLAAIPATITLAEAPINVPLPPKQAPKDSAHHTGIIASLPPKLISMAFKVGIIVATKGILSTMAENRAETPKMVKVLLCISPLVAVSM